METIIKKFGDAIFEYRKNTVDDRVVKGVFEENAYNFEEDLKGKIVIDIGAQIGTASILAGLRGATVFAFEPEKDSYNLLVKNIIHNKLTKTVKAYNFAIGSPGIRLLYVNDKNTAGNSLRRQDFQNAPEQTIEVLSLKAVLDLCGVPVCDILKIDCEGCEFEVFPEILAGLDKRIKTIKGEVHDFLFSKEENKRLDLCNLYKKQKIQRYSYQFTHK